MSLRATGLSRSFGRHPAVTVADVDLQPGRISGLVGPNGAGKTTLLLLLAGLLAPTRAPSPSTTGPWIPPSNAAPRVGCPTCSAPGKA